jgi:hypothetical protein
MISGLGPVGPIAGNFSAIPYRFNDRREVTSTNTLNVAIGLGAAHNYQYFCQKKAILAFGHYSCAVRPILRLRRRALFNSLLFSTACVTFWLYFCLVVPVSPAGPTSTLINEYLCATHRHITYVAKNNARGKVVGRSRSLSPLYSSSDTGSAFHQRR